MSINHAKTEIFVLEVYILLIIIFSLNIIQTNTL